MPPSPPPLPGSYLVLELTNRCNLVCGHCSRATGNDPHQARQGDLDPALALRLLADLAAFGAHIDTLILFWLGEPLLHPHFTDLYPALLRANERHPVFSRIEVHTNATLLDSRVRSAIINEARTSQVWHLTLDATTRETYTRIKGVDRLDQVEAQVHALIEARAASGAPWPRLVTQFIVSDRNVDESLPFRHRWEHRFRKHGLPVRTAFGQVPEGRENVVFFRMLDCPTPEEQARQNQVFRVAAASMDCPMPATSAPSEMGRNIQPCSAFWKSPVISWNGDVTVCTRDSALMLGIGNIRETPFPTLWWGAPMAALRRRVARGDYDDLPLCASCFIPRSANYTDLSGAEILRQRAWDDIHAIPGSETRLEPSRLVTPRGGPPPREGNL